MEKLKVNDGGGLFDSAGLIDSMIVDCNNMTKALVSGNYVEYAMLNVGMVQKLNELKKGIKNDTDSLLKQLEELKGVEGNAAGPVCDTLDGTMGSGEERIRDAFAPAGGGLEPDPDHTGT